MRRGNKRQGENSGPVWSAQEAGLSGTVHRQGWQNAVRAQTIWAQPEGNGISQHQLQQQSKSADKVAKGGKQSVQAHHPFPILSYLAVATGNQGTGLQMGALDWNSGWVLK